MAQRDVHTPEERARRRAKSYTSLLWHIGEDIPAVPNKRRGSVIIGSVIAPIFFNTLRGCGAVPVRCSTGDLREGDEVTVDLDAGTVTDEKGKTLTEFKVEPASIRKGPSSMMYFCHPSPDFL